MGIVLATPLSIRDSRLWRVDWRRLNRGGVLGTKASLLDAPAAGPVIQEREMKGGTER